MHGFFVTLGFGLVTAALLAFSAVSVSLQYGVSNHPNFAHGELLTIGAYAAYVSQGLTTNLPTPTSSGLARRSGHTTSGNWGPA